MIKDTTIIMSFTQPTIVDMTKTNNTLTLSVDWKDNTGIGKVLITKNQNGYEYVDIPTNWTRTYRNEEHLVWNHELPIKKELLELKTNTENE
jgi:hypothetical protein